MTCIYPAGLLADIDGKDVLCLASGGGQQSAVFSLLGAKVTVVDQEMTDYYSRIQNTNKEVGNKRMQRTPEGAADG